MGGVSSETRVVVAADAYYVANEKDIESILLVGVLSEGGCACRGWRTLRWRVP
jgi:hypothetical protein